MSQVFNIISGNPVHCRMVSSVCGSPGLKLSLNGRREYVARCLI
jgi:hypothetical protein